MTPRRQGRVDVGVVTYNTRDLTVSALRRLVEGTTDVDIRLLVYDNASADGTAEAVAREVPSALVIAGERNLGFAAGTNALIARSDADWFLALNSDAWPEPGALRTLLDTGLAQPRAGALAPLLLRPDGALEHSTHPFPGLRVAAVSALGGYQRFGRAWAEEHLLNGAWRHDRARRVDWAVGAALLMRRAAIEEVGGFDERFFMYAEDLEWCWRAARWGWEIWFTPDAVVRHVGNASGETAYGTRRSAAVLRNTYRFYRGAHGRASTWAFRSLNAFGAVRLILRALLQGDRARARFWAAQLPLHLGLTPDRDDRPPGASA